MTLLEKLQAAGLPAISVNEETGAITMGAMTPEQEVIYDDIILEHYQPEAYAEKQERETNAVDFSNEFQIRIARLTQIATVAKPSPFSQADIGNMFDAIQDMARNQRAILKRIK